MFVYVCVCVCMCVCVCCNFLRWLCLTKVGSCSQANSGDEPSLIMREKEFEWPFPLSFLNTLKKEQPQAYKAFQLAWFLGVLALACWPGVFN